MIMDQIEQLIEEEIQRRLEPLLRSISVEFEISYETLIRVIPEKFVEGSSTCMGVSKKTNKRCKKAPMKNGFCSLHQEQVPLKKSMTETIKHTHSLPPFFLKGCPACEERNKFRDEEISISNEEGGHSS